MTENKRNYYTKNEKMMVDNCLLLPLLLQQPLCEELVIESVCAQVEGDEVFFQQALDGTLYCACCQFVTLKERSRRDIRGFLFLTDGHQHLLLFWGQLI